MTVSAIAGLPPGSTPLRWVAEGRVLPDPADGAGLWHEWPGVAILARFTGAGLLLALDDPENRFRVVVDGRPVALLTRPGKTVVAIDGLGPGTHELRLERLSEAGAPRRIDGIHVPPGGVPLPPPALPARRIDVYGDSDSVGFGNTRGDRHCTGDDVFLSTDTTAAWPAGLTRRYYASASVVARSGIGVIRGHAGSQAGQSMIEVHDRILPSRAEPKTTADPAWLVIVEVGANDFVRPVEPGEAWSDAAALSQAFSRSFGQFLRGLVRNNPGRPVLVLAIPDAGAAPPPEMAQVGASLHAEGAPVLVVTPTGLDHRGCGWHPSLADHARIETAVAEAIDALILSGALEDR